MKHLTRIPKDENEDVRAYTLYVNVPVDEAQKISDALVVELGEDTIGKKSAFVRDCVVNGAMEPVAQARNEHALEIANTPPAFYTLDDLEEQLLDIQKALRGWPTTMSRDFVEEDSDEFKAWQREQGNDSN